MDRMSEAGLRVMAGARRDLRPSSFDPKGDLLGYVTELEMSSLVAMVDPPRDESKAAVADAQAAHIRVRMVTGDDVGTGAAIAKQLGIPGEAMLGADFAALSDEERLARIDGIGVVGRVAPEHKVLLAETLKKRGHVVAMTGDGVNDAPAIKAADIGIAMGSGTDVAKDAGRMILSDDNFATIVYAVEQGRKLYDNLNKYIRFVLLELVAFVLTFLGATLLNIAGGQPFTPSQILWINFLVNAPFGIALGFDQETPGLMKRHPRPRGESILTTGVKLTCGLGGAFVAVANLLLIELGIHHYGDIAIGQSIGLVGVLADARRRGFRVAKRDGLDLHDGHLQQLADEHDRRRRGRGRLSHHPRRLLAALAGHHLAHLSAVGRRAPRRTGALGVLGDREMDRPALRRWRRRGLISRRLRPARAPRRRSSSSRASRSSPASP